MCVQEVCKKCARSVQEGEEMELFRCSAHVETQPPLNPLLFHPTCSVCSSWRSSLKNYMQQLKPRACDIAALSSPWPSIVKLDMPIARSKFDGSATFLTPLSVTGPVQPGSTLHCQFPNLSALNLEGQVCVCTCVCVYVRVRVRARVRMCALLLADPASRVLCH